MKTIYNQFRFSGPNGETPEEYRDILGTRYGLTPFWFLFCKDTPAGYNDDEWLRTCLKNYNFIPPSVMVGINREGPLYSPHAAIEQYGSFDTNLILRNTSILKICRELRPDCQFAFYANCPLVTWHRELKEAEESLERDYARCRPIADRSDYLMPSFYFPKSLCLIETLTIIRRMIDRCRRAYVGKRLIPIISPYWVGTKEPIPANYIRPILDTYTAHGIDEIILWTETNEKWTPDLPWFTEVLNWQNME